MHRYRMRWTDCALVLAACLQAAHALAQLPANPNPPPQATVPYALDSGPVEAPGRGSEPVLLWSALVEVHGAYWLRVPFSQLELSGDPAANGAFVRLTSLHDGYWQRLNAESAAQWQNHSAFFNGGELLVELWGYPGTGASRVAIEEVTIGLPPLGGQDDLCGGDDRVLSSDPRMGRHSSGCTAFLIDDTNNMLLTAGHCRRDQLQRADVAAERDHPVSSAGGPVQRRRSLDAVAAGRRRV